jgi:hypothetical protein
MLRSLLGAAAAAAEAEPEHIIFSDEILSIPTMDYKSTASKARTRP